MKDPDEKWHKETYIATHGFEITMQNFDYSFILNISANIFPQTDSLFDILQEKIHDIVYCIIKVKEFKETLKKKM